MDWSGADSSALFGVFPRDYEALTTYVNPNANCLWGSQLINHFEYNGAGDLAPDIRQVLIDGIEVARKKSMPFFVRKTKG